MQYIVILAGGHNEAMVYAQSRGLKVGTYRYATRAATIRGLRNAVIHELPSFKNRIDRHSIEAALRYAQHLERIQIEDWEWPVVPRPSDLPAPEHLTSRVGEQMDLMDELALTLDKAETVADKVVDHVVTEAPVEAVVEHVEEKAPETKPKRPRKKAAAKPASDMDFTF